MKLVYLGRSDRRDTPAPALDGDVLELLANNWDDFGNKTTFRTTCRFRGEKVDLGYVKLLIEDQHTSSNYLDRLRGQGWTGDFPIPSGNYLSVPGEITFYEQLIALVGLEQALVIAIKLRDASYLVNTLNDSAALNLVQTTAFRKSLQRERGDIKAFLDGWKLFASQAMAVMDLGFHFRDVYGKTSKLDLKFQTSGPLPHDINVLIGPNGVGKGIYPQFSITPLNLFPMCDACQLAKKEKTGDAYSPRYFIHPYFDTFSRPQIIRLTINAPYETPTFALAATADLTPEEIALVTSHIRELGIEARYIRFFKAEYRRLRRNVARMRGSAQDVANTLETFRTGAADPTRNSWQHVFYSAVLANQPLLNYLSHGPLPAYP